MARTFDLEVVKYGDSIVITLPRLVRKETGLKAGDYVRISIQKLKLVPDSEKEGSRK
jgi:antitoxin component of MazEF toxin-antitoxin module